MSKLFIPYFRWRFIIALLLLASLVFMFWTSSRYPSLGDKALLAGDIKLEDPLSFVAIFPIDPSDPGYKRIFFSTINWLDTNRQGMTFGVLFGSIFLTLMRYVRSINFSNQYANSALGILIGTPLGVCVNCAAPIAKGMYDGGARAETTLSTMIASPTFNIVVLNMVFALMPFYIFGAKIALTILLIMVLIPLICRILPKHDLQIAEADMRTCPIPSWEERQIETEKISDAIKGVAGNLMSDFWYIFKITVPLMILAGFLGAVIGTLVPLESLQVLQFGLVGLLIVALIGTFLPVPIAFDVVICAALLGAGLPVGYVMCLLFTLGTFSIYSAFIVTQTISIRPALYLYFAVVLLGVFAGYGAQKYHDYQSAKAIEELTTEAPVADKALSDHIDKAFNASARRATGQKLGNEFTLELEVEPFAPKSLPGDTPFIRKDAHNIGIDKPIEFSFKDMWPPFWEGRGITSGDFDRDGDTDIVLSSTEIGLFLFLNDGTGQFKLNDPFSDATKSMDIFNAVLVDIDNDGWLDLFITTYKDGNYWLKNTEGQFGDPQHVANNPKTPLTLSLSFGDVDQDGDLDAVMGNWAAGWYRRVPGEESRNRVIFNDGSRFKGDSFIDLPGIPGESLSVLLSDINNDQKLDLMVGNDFEIPDAFYLGDGAGRFEQIKRGDGLIPNTTTTTMSIKNNDLDNNLIPEIYIAQIAGRSSGISERLQMQPIEQYCDRIERAEDKAKCQKNMDIKTWYKSGNNFDPTYAGKCEALGDIYKKQCKAMLLKDLAIQARDPTMCKLIALDQPEARHYCEVHFWPSRPYTNADVAANIEQINGRNVLLSRTNISAPYSDQAIDRHLEVGGWSWDTKIADFDNDGWLDILIVNGTWVPNEVTPSNMFFHNDGTGRFDQRARDFGLEDYFMTAAALQIDLEGDGDLDIITVPVNAPMQVYINSNQTAQAIGFEFDDHLGNRFGIGHKVTVHYGPGRVQRQEVQLGGGFQSFDTAYLHFGLGDQTVVDFIEIDWVEGGSSKMDGPFKAGNRYTIKRSPNGSQ